nr:PREDICTED: protocadherin gamma-C5 isoform X12 [Latimeria chalumnae]|eukprot:XP_005995389.1 PREDICTED: protocadherin gamma-C5 isoform X12 [Latimeria chalumnae]
MEYRERKEALLRQVLRFFICSFVFDFVSGQIRYSITEEMKSGSFVADIVKDLGIDALSISARNLRLVSNSRKQYFNINMEDGSLVIKEQIDRESLCGLNPTCSLSLQIVLQNPLESHRVEIEILDINDNTPQFPINDVRLKITEAANLGAHFLLDIAQDPDVGSNSLSFYQLSHSDYFALSVNTRTNGVKVPEIVLEKALDREHQTVYTLTLTAFDGGIPPKSGTAKISINIQDVNDNAPVFDQLVYKVSLLENIPIGTFVLKVKATDLDEGPNGEIEYSFSSSSISEHVQRLFSLDSHTGEIRIKGAMDFEESKSYEFNVRAKDKGSPAMEGRCTIHIDLIDVNDNAPELVLTSLISSIEENASFETGIGLISVRDIDSGENGLVNLQITQDLPFKLISSFQDHYSLVTNGVLDRENVSQYNITFTATDSGTPSLSTKKTIVLNVADVNDNSPRFARPEYTVHIQENNPPGASIGSVTASDPDSGMNSKLSYSLLDNKIQGMSVSSYVYINSDNGSIYSLRSLDYEQIKVFQIAVQVKDAGSPPLSSTVTIYVFVLDQNDNAPTIIYPPVKMDSAVQLTLPQLADAGFLVTKIVAVDVDNGHNAWLSYKVLQDTDPKLFSVSPHTGEQIPPNTDWRFSQGQRPGTSGSQPPTDEIAAWPSNQMDSERLQNMMAAAAAANEPSDGGSTMGAGTLGLSTRYGPQFTLQHVPDYRQNVYIPGSMSSLSNAGQQGGKKKKSGKKDKK